MNSHVFPTCFKTCETEKKDEKTIIVRCNLTSMEDINKWVEEYGRITYTKWCVRKSVPKGSKIHCSKYFVCHHSSYRKVEQEKRKQGASKNTACGAYIKICIKLDTNSTRKTDVFVKKGLRGVIELNSMHNHRLETAESFRHLPADDLCKKTFFEYFNDGMGVPEAHKYHQQCLMMKSDFENQNLANSRINPMKQTLYYWYSQWRNTNLGPRTGAGMIEKLKEKISAYAEKGVTVAYKEDPFAVLISTPIMKRAHKLPCTEDIIFIDSTSSCDAESHAITFLLTPCSVGAVPIGIFITKGQSEDAYKQGFQLLKETLQDSAFNFKGAPHIFLTDHSEAEINALRKTWPTSKNLLCIFHVGQAVWRWLWDAKNSIPKEHRRQLMFSFQNILYASNIELATAAYMNAIGYVGTYLPTYNSWNAYIGKYWEYEELWCLAFRDETVRGHHTNNFSEVAIRIFKDEVLCRVKAYNVITLVDFSATILEDYYKRRLQEFANSRNSGPRLLLQKMKKNALDAEKPILKEDVTEIGEEGHEFYVKGENDIYSVNVKTACCSCPSGMFGRFCKHQFAVYYHFNICGRNFPPIEAKDRYEMAYLALGEDAPPVAFYEPLQQEQPEVHQVCASTSSKSADVMVDDEDDDCTAPVTRIEKGDLKQQLLKRFESLMEQFDPSVSGLEKALFRLNKITSEGQMETMLHTLGQNAPLHRKPRVAIRVQPTSISRRSVSVTRGSKRLPSGRPSNSSAPRAKKRKHNLTSSVKLNQLNAKLH